MPAAPASLKPALAAAALAGCVSFAAPPPLVTLGGPRLAPEGGTQLALGAGTGVSLFPGAHAGGDAWFARFRYGLGRADFGADVLGLRRADKGTLTAKLAGRLRLESWLTAELGAGAADDSDGKSINAEAGLTAGSRRRKTWDAYAALRLAGARGITHNPTGGGQPGAQDAVLCLGTAGAAAQVSEAIRFVFEGGWGVMAVRHTQGFGQAAYLGAGLVFDLP